MKYNSVLILLLFFFIIGKIDVIASHEKYRQYFEKYAKREGISVNLLKAIAMTETHGTKIPQHAVSSAMAIGICQIIPSTFYRLRLQYKEEFGHLDLIDLIDPEINIMLSARLIRDIGRSAKRKFNVSSASLLYVRLIGIGYNAGMSKWKNLKRPFKRTGITETDKYLIRLEKHYISLNKRKK